MRLKFYSVLRSALSEDRMELNLAMGFGLLGFFACLVLYIVMYTHALANDTGPLDALLLTNIVLHVATGVLVFIDARMYVGSSIILQTIIQSMGSYITFSLASVGGFWIYVNTEHDNEKLTELVVAFLALGAACVSNSVLLSMLFAYFHKGTQSALNLAD